jgi:hypothetical protein
MYLDEIVEEVRAAREAYAREFNYDIRAMCKDLRERQATSGHKVVSFPPRKPVTVPKKPAAA